MRKVIHWRYCEYEITNYSIGNNVIVFDLKNFGTATLMYSDAFAMNKAANNLFKFMWSDEKILYPCELTI